MLLLPDNTLIFRGKDQQVGVVDDKGVVQLRDGLRSDETLAYQSRDTERGH